METNNLIRVVIVDDQNSIQDGIVALLKRTSGFEVVGQAYTGEAALKLCAVAKPDIVLMDVIMPGMGGAETTRALLKRFPDMKILALSSFREAEQIREMLEAGATGYLAKDAISLDLIDTIRTSVQGNTVLSPEVRHALLDSPQTIPESGYGLTEREMQVLKLMAAGRTYQEIAAELVVSLPTVRFHVNNILAKFKVETRSEVLVISAKHGLV